MNGTSSVGPGTWYLAPRSHTPVPVCSVAKDRFVDPWPGRWIPVGKGSCDVSVKGNGPLAIAGLDLTGVRGPHLNSFVSMLQREYFLYLGFESSDASFRLWGEVECGMVLGGVSPLPIFGLTAYMAMASQLTGGLVHPPPAPPLRQIPIMDTQPTRRAAGAYRCWRKWYATSDDMLESPVYSGLHDWVPGWNKMGGGHTGAKGFYGFATATDMVEGAGWRHALVNPLFSGPGLRTPVFGSVLLAGRVIRGQRGYRAQYVMPESLILTGDLDKDAGILRVADRYQMTVCTLDEAFAMPNGLVPYQGELPDYTEPKIEGDDSEASE